MSVACDPGQRWVIFCGGSGCHSLIRRLTTAMMESMTGWQRDRQRRMASVHEPRGCSGEAEVSPPPPPPPGARVTSVSRVDLVVAVSDDGGSSRSLIDTFGGPAVGDVRNVVLTLAQSAVTTTYHDDVSTPYGEREAAATSEFLRAMRWRVPTRHSPTFSSSPSPDAGGGADDELDGDRRDAAFMKQHALDVLRLVRASAEEREDEESRRRPPSSAAASSIRLISHCRRETAAALDWIVDLLHPLPAGVSPTAAPEEGQAGFAWRRASCGNLALTGLMLKSLFRAVTASSVGASSCSQTDQLAQLSLDALRAAAKTLLIACLSTWSLGVEERVLVLPAGCRTPGEPVHCATSTAPAAVLDDGVPTHLPALLRALGGKLPRFVLVAAFSCGVTVVGQTRLGYGTDGATKEVEEEIGRGEAVAGGNEGCRIAVQLDHPRACSHAREGSGSDAGCGGHACVALSVQVVPGRNTNAETVGGSLRPPMVPQGSPRTTTPISLVVLSTGSLLTSVLAAVINAQDVLAQIRHQRSPRPRVVLLLNGTVDRETQFAWPTVGRATVPDSSLMATAAVCRIVAVVEAISGLTASSLVCVRGSPWEPASPPGAATWTVCAAGRDGKYDADALWHTLHHASAVDVVVPTPFAQT